MDKIAHLKINFSESTGEIKQINGGNIGPSLRDSAENVRDFKSLRIPLTRLHDDALFNSGARIVDIHHIFGNWDADEHDKRNYYFQQTDDYIRRIIENGSAICFRLGTSIEGGQPHYYAFPPEDFNKWATICTNIVRHYNEGWHNGHNWHIRYWEIWNEPDLGPPMWSGTAQQYYELYGTAAKRLKSRFPNIKIGGPAVASIKGTFGGIDWCTDFLKYCRDNEVDLDFFSCHRYATNVEEFEIAVRDSRKLLDEFGFVNTEIHLNEWHYRGNFFGNTGGPEAMDSITSAVHAAAVLTAFQDVPIDMGCFYIVGTTYSEWGCWKKRVGRTNLFYAFKAFAQMLDYRDRVKATSDVDNIRILAGMNNQKQGAALITNFKGECDIIEVENSRSHWNDIEVAVLNEHFLLTSCTDWHVNSGKLILPKTDESSMYLITRIAQ